MRRFAPCALSLNIVVVSFAGCGTSSGTPSLPAGPAVTAQSPARGTGEVQYFSNATDYTILEYDYPKGESPIGSIAFTGGAECTTGARTFWTVGAGVIAEFAVGGTAPIRVLEANAVSCAVDPATGNLAATLSNGGVIIFRKARGTGKLVAALSKAYFDGYDNQSNLFVDGFSSSQTFALVERKKRSNAFVTISTSNLVNFPGSVQWDGEYLTILDQVAGAIYRYAVNGTNATLKGTVVLAGSADCGQTWIARPYVYCADAGNNNGEVYKYPTGGSHVATLAGLDSPVGVVSLRAR